MIVKRVSSVFIYVDDFSCNSDYSTCAVKILNENEFCEILLHLQTIFNNSGEITFQGIIIVFV